MIVNQASQTLENLKEKYFRGMGMLTIALLMTPKDKSLGLV